MFNTKGIITYEPTRNMEGKSKWWLTIELPYFEDTARYFRWMIDRNWCEADSRIWKRDYHRPPHRFHVSVIRGEKPRANLQDWGKFMEGKKVNVGYSNYIRQTSIERDGKDHFWFVDAQYDFYAGLRKHFGLDYERNGVPFKGHITVARAFDK